MPTLFKSKIQSVLPLLERLRLLEEVDDQDDRREHDQVREKADDDLKYLFMSAVKMNCGNRQQAVVPTSEKKNSDYSI